MAETLGTYYFQVAPSADGIGKEMENVLSGAGESAGGMFSSGLTATLGAAGAVLGTVTAAVAGLTAAVYESGQAFLEAAVDVSEYGDNIDKMSQKANMSATSYQEWDAVLQHSGASASSLVPIMKNLSVQAEKNNEAFQALGISEEQVATMSQEDLFAAVITGLQGMEEGTERTYIANQLLGRGATELGALLNTSAEETQAMKDRLHELGGVMSDEDVEAAAAFQDSLQDMTTGFDALQRNLVSEFLPSMTTVMDGVTDILAGDQDAGLEKIGEGVEAFSANLEDLAPKIITLGGELLSSLSQAILQNLPLLVQTGADTIIALIDGLSANSDMIIDTLFSVFEILLGSLGDILPKLLELANEIVRGLATHLIDAAPELIPAVTEIITELVTMFVQIMGENAELGTQLLGAIGEGLIKAIPILVQALPPIIEGFVNFFLGNIVSFIELGTTLLTALLSDGNLSTIITTLVATIPEIITSIIDAVLEFIPDVIQAGFDLLTSLLANTPDIIVDLLEGVVEITDSILQKLADVIVDFEDIGGQIMQGLADGILKAGDSVVQTAKDVLGKIPQGAKDLFQINSPSKLFEGYGQYIDEGLAIGIEDNADMPEDAMVTMTSDTIASYQPATAEASATAVGQGETGARGDIVIPVYIGQERIDEIIVQANNRVNYMSGGH